MMGPGVHLDECLILRGRGLSALVTAPAGGRAVEAQPQACIQPTLISLNLSCGRRILRRPEPVPALAGAIFADSTNKPVGTDRSELAFRGFPAAFPSLTPAPAEGSPIHENARRIY